uniref:C-type lectin domain-containing protein n=1 Tax=Cyprinus carpio TaxID=7962 RepID=A0A8C2GXH4_CYPCA
AGKFLRLLSFTSSQISHQYHFINIRKTWTEAQRFCREMYTDLATVNNDDEMNSFDVWIGLFKDFWSWSDQSNISFRFWNFSLLKPMDRHHNCTVVMVNQTGRWNDVQCNITLPFICHGLIIITFHCPHHKRMMNFCKFYKALLA